MGDVLHCATVGGLVCAVAMPASAACIAGSEVAAAPIQRLATMGGSLRTGSGFRATESLVRAKGAMTKPNSVFLSRTDRGGAPYQCSRWRPAP